MIDSPPTTYRFSERHFRRYENCIRSICQNWPMPTIFEPLLPDGKRLSTETFSCRLRDAVKSMRDNQWPSVIPMQRFVQIVDEIVISTISHPGKVAAGPYESLRKLVPAGVPIEIKMRVDHVVLDNPDAELIRAVLLLHHHHILIEPSTITTKLPLSAEALDVEVEKDGETYTIY